jgi:DNA-binding XRE family transcriptional regulator
MKKKQKKAKKLTLNRETMVHLENELVEANGGVSVPCQPTFFKTCQTCCFASCT